MCLVAACFIWSFSGLSPSSSRISALLIGFTIQSQSSWTVPPPQVPVSSWKSASPLASTSLQPGPLSLGDCSIKLVALTSGLCWPWSPVRSRRPLAPEGSWNTGWSHAGNTGTRSSPIFSGAERQCCFCLAPPPRPPPHGAPGVGTRHFPYSRNAAACAPTMGSHTGNNP